MPKGGSVVQLGPPSLHQCCLNRPARRIRGALNPRWTGCLKGAYANKVGLVYSPHHKTKHANDAKNCITSVQVYLLNVHIQQADCGRVLITEFIFTAGIVEFFLSIDRSVTHVTICVDVIIMIGILQINKRKTMNNWMNWLPLCHVESPNHKHSWYTLSFLDNLKVL